MGAAFVVLAVSIAWSMMTPASVSSIAIGDGGNAISVVRYRGAANDSTAKPADEVEPSGSRSWGTALWDR